jgi:hypothetical protein
LFKKDIIIVSKTQHERHDFKEFIGSIEVGMDFSKEEGEGKGGT